ncbi:hypothetical protein RSOLAG22IIIB_09634 [Rhizoctonia solani]|uniref:Uncharacterized protein n=1 Tax=Rhizoctonia solani TaxID=456999 RepID=A0A0K6FZE6_9AGAM|nr:hypothetical protein RSOLAG22IIIB_09634 [Rhizoctonia solani]
MSPYASSTYSKSSGIHRIITPLGTILWTALYFVTLGFSHKYRQRLRSFERLHPQYAIDDYDNARSEYSCIPSGTEFHYEAYKEHPTYLGVPYRLENTDRNRDPQNPRFERVNLDYDEPLRTRQRGEWEKLSTAASVITAASAAALAIPDLAGAGAYWMVNTCFCVALGVSIEGLILVFYITIMASGASDETIGRLARGKVKLLGSFEISPRLPALIMALPVVFATYSSLFLLIGCTVMIMMGPNYSADPVPNHYYYLPLAPIGFGFICGCSAVLVSEVATLREEELRRPHREGWVNIQRELVMKAPPLGMVYALPGQHEAVYSRVRSPYRRFDNK